MSECTHDCSTCSANCSSRDKKSMIEAPNKLAKIKKVIGIMEYIRYMKLVMMKGIYLFHY